LIIYIAICLYIREEKKKFCNSRNYVRKMCCDGVWFKFDAK
jgi:hypothetical protein